MLVQILAALPLTRALKGRHAEDCPCSQPEEPEAAGAATVTQPGADQGSLSPASGGPRPLPTPCCAPRGTECPQLRVQELGLREVLLRRGSTGSTGLPQLHCTPWGAPFRTGSFQRPCRQTGKVLSSSSEGATKQSSEHSGRVKVTELGRD